MFFLRPGTMKADFRQQVLYFTAPQWSFHYCCNHGKEFIKATHQNIGRDWVNTARLGSNLLDQWRQLITSNKICYILASWNQAMNLIPDYFSGEGPVWRCWPYFPRAKRNLCIPSVWELFLSISSIKEGTFPQGGLEACSTENFKI